MIRQIAEYNIVQGASPLKLSQNVMVAIRDGFEPFGPPIMLSGNDIMQAVVKYEDVDEASES